MIEYIVLIIAYGIRRFSIGLAKKVLIANALGELCTKAFALNETTVIFFIGYLV